MSAVAAEASASGSTQRRSPCERCAVERLLAARAEVSRRWECVGSCSQDELGKLESVCQTCAWVFELVRKFFGA